jgi:fructose-bisphosphate aldolase class II
MPLQSIVPMLTKAQAEGYAVGLFDVHTLEGTLAVTEAAVEQCSPVIVAPFFAPRPAMVALIRELVADAPVPVAIQLDHGREFKDVIECIRAGFTDVMLDASTEPYEENVALTRRAVNVAHAAGMGVEGELGHVGRGEAYAQANARKAGFTRPEDAERFVAETGVDALAVAFGSVHGVFKGGGEPELDLDLLDRIRERVGVPLVLHGGSGVSDEDLRAAIQRGICKVNVYTDMALAAVAAMRQSLADPETPYFEVGRTVVAAIKEVVVDRMQLFGSAGRA